MRWIVSLLVASTTIFADGDYVTIADGQILVTTAEMENLQSGKAFEPLSKVRLAHLSYRTNDGSLFLNREGREWRKSAVGALRSPKDSTAWSFSAEQFFSVFKQMRQTATIPDDLVLQPSGDRFQIMAKDESWYLFPKTVENGSTSVAVYWKPGDDASKLYDAFKNQPSKIYHTHYYISEMEIAITEATPNGPMPVAEPTDGIYFVTHRLAPLHSAKIIMGQSSSPQKPIVAKVSLKDKNLLGSFPATPFIDSVLLPIIQENDKSIEGLTFDGVAISSTEPVEKEKDKGKGSARAGTAAANEATLDFVLDPEQPEATKLKFFIHDKANRDIVFRCDIRFKEAKF